MAATDVRVARRYAQALFGVAGKRGTVEAVSQDLAAAAEVLHDSPQLRAVLHHPRVPRERKRELVHHLFGGKVVQDVENFLLLLVERDRSPIMPDIATEFGNMVDVQRHQTDAVVTSAVALTPEQQEALRQKLEATTGSTVRLSARVDPNILGGLVVRVGDKLIDGSVATQLQRMRDRLRNAKVA